MVFQKERENRRRARARKGETARARERVRERGRKIESLCVYGRESVSVREGGYAPESRIRGTEVFHRCARETEGMGE